MLSPAVVVHIEVDTGHWTLDSNLCRPVTSGVMEMMERNPEEELFQRLAEAIGESLEQVCNMADAERRQLMEVVIGRINVEGNLFLNVSLSALLGFVLFLMGMEIDFQQVLEYIK